MIFLLWIVLSIVVGVYASNKKISGGFAFGFFMLLSLSPVIGLVATLVSKPDETAMVEKGGMKKCPHCAELVKQEATKCRYCGAELEVIKVKDGELVTENRGDDGSAGVAYFLGGIFVLCLVVGAWFLAKAYFGF